MNKFFLLLVFILTLTIASPVWAAQTVVVAPTSANQEFQTESGIVWVNHNEGFAFYVIANDAGLYYTRTLDGGLTWFDNTKIQTSADTNSRISNYAVWYDRWTPQNTGDIIHIAWLDAVSDQLHYVPFDVTANPFLGTELNIQSLTAFTISVGHSTGGVTITKAIGGYLYIAMRSSTSLSNGNRFMRSIDNGANWTTRTISPTPASVQTVKGLILPGNETDGLGGFINSNDIFGWNLPNGGTNIEVWLYDDSANTWSIIHTVTVSTAITATGICPCAMAFNRISGRAWVGVRDATTTASSTFYIAEIQSPTAVVNRTAPFSAQTNRGEGIALYYDQTGTVQLIASSITIVGGESRPTVAVSLDQGISWSVEQVIDTTDSMANPHVAPHSLSGGDRWAPIFTSLNAAQNSLELESGMNIDNTPVFSIDNPAAIPDDSVGDKISRAMNGLGFGGTSGNLIFAMGTFVLLAVLLFKVQAPPFIAFPVLALWGGGLTILGFLPAWIMYVSIMVGGIGAVMLFTRSGQGEE